LVGKSSSQGEEQGMLPEKAWHSYRAGGVTLQEEGYQENLEINVSFHSKQLSGRSINKAHGALASNRVSNPIVKLRGTLGDQCPHLILRKVSHI
jgi:hypothetical protein